MTDLKPCPFCGGEAEVYEMNYGENGKYSVFGVFCVDDSNSELIGLSKYQHGHFIDNFLTEAEAIAAWNARADAEYGSVPATDENMAKYGWVRERTCRNIAEPDEMSDDPFTCSECGARGPYGEGIYHIGGSREVDGNLVFWDSWPVYKFCPNCGARVIGTEAGE